MRIWRSAALTFASIVLGFVLVGVSLSAAPGVTQISETSYDTTFSTAWVDATSLAIGAVLLVVIAFSSWRWGLLAWAGMVSAETLLAVLVVARFRETEWSDGLEVFIFLYPLFGALVGWVALGLGVGAGIAWRRRTALAADGGLLR